MRIDRLEIENFKKYAKQGFDFHPKFTLLVGNNGAGKTTVLDALAVAAGVWLVEVPDSTLYNSGRNILPSEVRLESEGRGDRVQFSERRPVIIKATGKIGVHEKVEWARQIHPDGKRTSNLKAREALAYVKDIYARDSAGQRPLCPVLAYYGAGRAWLPSNKKSKEKAKTNSSSRRWDAFYDCFNERVRTADLQEWFLGETLAAVNRGGKMRPGYEVVKRAILRCVPEADDLWFDPTDQRQIILSIAGKAQPFNNLSAGQGMMLAMVADLAIKAVKQNAHLLPPDDLGSEDGLPRVLRETPGLVLIDELDVHLHPRWQRRVATDLKETFPGIQFICTSHSPQVIGEVMPDEVRVLQGNLQSNSGGQSFDKEFEKPSQSFGMDSNWILKVLMDSNEMDPEITKDIKIVQELAVKRDFQQAHKLLKSLRERVGNSEQIQFAASTIDRIELLGK